MYGRVFFNNRFIRRGLACIVGLISASPVLAAQFETQQAANLHCLTVLENFLTNTSALTADADCVFDEAVTVVNGNTLSGGYICKVKTQTSQQMITNNRYNVGFCGSSGSATITNQNAEASFYDTFTFTSKYPSANPFSSKHYFYWSGETNQCLTSEDFESTSLMAATPNGSGISCYNNCSYSVSVGYSGTWPAGQFYSYFEALKQNCQPGDSQSVPLDFGTSDNVGIEDKTPNPGPNPGDGSGSGEGESSGGGSCEQAPNCSGDSLQCNILYQTWKTRCSLEGSGSGGGDGDGSGLEGVEGKLNEIANNQIEFAQDIVAGDAGPGKDGNYTGLTSSKTITSDVLNTQGFGFNRSCAFFEPINLTVGNAAINIDFNNTPGVCEIFIWTGYLVVAFASFLGCFILIKE